MTGHITDFSAAGTLTGAELLEVSQLSTTVTITATTLSAQASDNSYNDSGSGFVTAGFAVGDRVNVVGFTGNTANNILVGIVTALTAGKMTIGGTDGDVIVDDAAGESVTIAKWTTRRASLSALVAGAAYTDEQARDAIGSALVAGTGVTISVNDGADTITISGDAEFIRDTIGSALVAGTGISITVNDAGDTITITNTAPSAGTYTDENARDAVMAMLVGAGLLVETENDAGDTDTLTVNAASAADVQAGTSTAKAITPSALAGSAAPQTLTDGATISWDMSAGYNAKVTLGGNRTLATPTNPIAGLTYSLNVIQDATGSRTMTWPSAFDWGTTGAPTLTTTASKRDRITLFCTDAATPKFDAFLSGKGFS